jgi:hypothetical protein
MQRRMIASSTGQGGRGLDAVQEGGRSEQRTGVAGQPGAVATERVRHADRLNLQDGRRAPPRR